MKSFLGPLLLLVAMAQPVLAHCPFCATQGQTLSGEVNQADMIVLGKLQNAQQDPNDFTRGTTELVIEKIIAPHPYLNGKKILKLPRYINIPQKEQEVRFLVFCSLYPAQKDLYTAAVGSSLVLANFSTATLDAYRGEPLPLGSQLPEYLEGAIDARQQEMPVRLKYFFEYLNNKDLVISTDALMEYGNADYKDVRTVADKLPADVLLRWLKDPNTPPSKFGLLGLLIGHTNKPEYSKTVREMLEDPNNAFNSGLDGLMAGYILLDPKAGWDYITSLAKDTKRDFTTRFATLKVMRFFYDYRPDVISKKEVIEAVKLLIDQPDIADIPIEDLRKWKLWEHTDFILAYGEKEGHKKISIVRRAILRFALDAANHGQKSADAFVAKARKEDPDKVKIIEELLRDEQLPPISNSDQ